MKITLTKNDIEILEMYVPTQVRENIQEDMKVRELFLLRRDLRIHRKQVELLENQCEHPIDKSGETAYCRVCGRDFGWWCPESPDNTCHYFSTACTDAGIFVEMFDMQPRVQLASTHIVDHETEDKCIFCGKPEERQ